MAAYVIADVEVIDPVKFREYGNQVPATVEEYGGKYLVRGGAVEKSEGDWEPNREMARVRLLCWEVREAGGGSGRFGADVDYECTLGLAGN